MSQAEATSSKSKKSTVRHTRAIQRDRSKRPNTAPPDELVEQRLDELVRPAVYTQANLYHAMSLRERTLTLPIMVAFVLSRIWRQLGSVREAVRVLNQEELIWTDPVEVSHQAMSLRLRTFPAQLFEAIWHEVLPALHRRWQQRQRPLAPVLQWAQAHFTAVLILDGSTLDTLLRKVGLLREGEGTVLAGRMAALLDLLSRLPREIWYEEDEHAHDQRFWERVLTALTAGTLLIFDLGFLNYPLFDRLTAQGVYLLTRAKRNTSYQVSQVLQRRATIRDQIIHLGSTKDSQCAHAMRLVEVLHRGTWYRYLTNVRDPKTLPAEYVMALLATLARRRCLQHDQAVAGTGVFLGWLHQWRPGSGMGDLATLCSLGGSHGCRRGNLELPIQGPVNGHGLPGFVSFHASPSTRQSG